MHRAAAGRTILRPAAAPSPSMFRSPRLTLAIAATSSALAFPATALAGTPLVVSAEQVSAGQSAPVSFFDARVRPGSIARGRIVLRTRGHRPLRVDIARVNGVTAANLGSSYALPNERPATATRWVDVARPSVTVVPGRRTVVPVSFRVPRGAPGGDWLSGISVKPSTAPAAPKRTRGVQVASEQRYVIGALLRVAGPRTTSVRLTAADVAYAPGGLTFTVDARNDGTTLLRGVRGRIVVRRDGARVVDHRIAPGTFLAKSDVGLSVLTRRERPEEGTVYRIDARLRYGNGRVARLSRTVRFGHVAAKAQEQFGGPPARREATGRSAPLWLAAVAAALLLALALALAFVWRRRRRSAGRLLGSTEAAKVLRAEREAGRRTSVLIIETELSGDVVANLLQGHLRPLDRFAARDGGRGLMVLLRRTEPATAAALAHTLGDELTGLGAPATVRLLGDEAGDPVTNDGSDHAPPAIRAA